MCAYLTIKGFVTGDEPPDLTPDVRHHATLRIHSGSQLDFDEIEAALGVKATRTWRRGEPVGMHGLASKGPPSKHDVWLYDAPIDEHGELDGHVMHLRDLLVPRAEFMAELRSHAVVSLLVGYSSNLDHGGFDISPRALELFTILEVPLVVYVVVGPSDADEEPD